MIKIGRINDVDANNDRNLLIVRSLKTLPANAVQEARLSPSQGLFYAYLDAKKRGEFNSAWFQRVYVPRFIKELVADRNNLAILDELYRASFHEDILLACFCTDETLCHRSIVAGMLLGAGARITCSEDYRKYYRMFQEACASQ